MDKTSAQRNLVAKLRGHQHHPANKQTCYRCEAADTIELLEGKVERLTDMLNEITGLEENYDDE
jgi:hypothetical protein